MGLGLGLGLGWMNCFRGVMLSKVAKMISCYLYSLYLLYLFIYI